MNTEGNKSPRSPAKTYVDVSRASGMEFVDAFKTQFMVVARDANADQVHVAMHLDDRSAAILIGYLVDNFGLKVIAPTMLAKLAPLDKDSEPTHFNGTLERSAG